jgi:hypothetical protein
VDKVAGQTESGTVSRNQVMDELGKLSLETESGTKSKTISGTQLGIESRDRAGTGFRDPRRGQSPKQSEINVTWFLCITALPFPQVRLVLSMMFAWTQGIVCTWCWRVNKYNESTAKMDWRTMLSKLKGIELSDCRICGGWFIRWLLIVPQFTCGLPS